MKKLVIVLICGLMVVPCAAWGQKWIDSYTDKDGTYVEGHWQVPDDTRKDKYSTPGQVNPYTGQFNPYNSGMKGPQPANPTPTPSNPYYPQRDYRYRGY
jgi:hypothetical protein